MAYLILLKLQKMKEIQYITFSQEYPYLIPLFGVCPGVRWNSGRKALIRVLLYPCVLQIP